MAGWPRSSSARIDDLFDLRARWQLLGQVVLALLAVALGIGIEVIANPFGDGVIRFERAVLDRVHGVLDRRA